MLPLRSPLLRLCCYAGWAAMRTAPANSSGRLGSSAWVQCLLVPAVLLLVR